MHNLFLDTCVWVDLAVLEFSLVDKLNRLIDEGKVTIVVPELIKNEWDGCKKKIIEQITKEVVDARRFTFKFISFVDELNTDVAKHLSSFDPISTSAKISAHRIQSIEKILNSNLTILVPVSDQTKILAIDLALQKKAPFQMRNSMADALIFLTAVEWVNANNSNKSVFVTLNTKDFSDEKRDDEDISFKERLHPDLQFHIKNNELEFGIVLGRVLNDIEHSLATQEEIDRGETVVEDIRVKDDVLEGLMSGGPAAQILEMQKALKEQFSGPAAQILEMQKALKEQFSGPAAQILEMQKVLKEQFSDPAAQILEMQKVLKNRLTDREKTTTIECQRNENDQNNNGSGDN